MTWSPREPRWQPQAPRLHPWRLAVSWLVSAPFSRGAPAHLLRTEGFEHVADITVGSFYDPVLDEGCAFEELICFHGGLGGPQTRPFALHPVALPGTDERIVGAERLHEQLFRWRKWVAASAGDGGPPPARPRRRESQGALR